MSQILPPPPNYLIYNAQNSKKLSIVVDIPGLDYLTSTVIGRTARYGDPIVYGGANLFYGGVVPLGIAPGERQQQSLLSLDASLTISQRLEPEQGRGSISTMAMSFIDKNQYMTQVCSPGILIPEILGQPVVIWVGFAQSSFPDDYYPIWRGRVAQTTPNIGKVTMQFTDPSIVRRQQIFQMGSDYLAADVGTTFAFEIPSTTVSAGTVYINNSQIFTVETSITSGTILSMEGTGSPSATGSLVLAYVFNVAPSNWSPGAVYGNNGQQFTIAGDSDVVGGTILTAAGTGAPTASGTLSLISGTGPPTIAFSSVSSSGPTPITFTAVVDSGFVFTIPSSTVGAGAIYSNNGQDFTVSQGIAGSTTLLCSGPGLPMSSGTLTKVSGTGPSTLAFSSFIAAGPDTEIFVTDNVLFADKILGPDGTYDQTIKTYLKIGDEFIEYQQTGQESVGFGNSNNFVNVIRGSRGTVPAAHTTGDSVDNFMQIEDSAINIALKIMLSGWNGPYLSNVALYGIVNTGDVNNPMQNNGIILPMSVDAIRDLGITAGDFVTITGATNGANDVTLPVTGFLPANGQTNRIITFDHTFTAEQPTPALIAIRSQYDTYPDLAGTRMPGTEVDVGGFQFYLNSYLFGEANSYNFLISSSDTDAGKTFIENQILLPLGAYSLTRQGKCSMGLTLPPLANQRTTMLDKSNVLDPANILVTRTLNNRKYFNEIDWSFDYDDAGDPLSQRDTIDAASLAQIGVGSVLPIAAKGARTSLNFLTIVENRERFLFLRYASAAIQIDIKTNYGTGNIIEVGDIIIVNDNGELQIPNLLTGQRNLGSQLFEVINRNVDIKTGVTQLQLLGGVGSLVTDRYATISPSSHVDAGSTSSRIVIKDSFGALFPGDEGLKWADYVGLNIHVHSYDYSVSGYTTFTGFDPTNPDALNVSPPLGFTPAADYIVDIDDYPTNTSPTFEALYKLVHCFWDPTVDVTSGVSSTEFNVGSGDVAKFKIGNFILVHNADYSELSDIVAVTNIVGTSIFCGDLGFIPDATCAVEMIGFPDGGNGYLFI